MSDEKILYAGLSGRGLVLAAAIAAAGLFNAGPLLLVRAPTACRVKKRRLPKPADRSKKKHLLKGVRP